MPGKGISEAERAELAERFKRFEKEWQRVNKKGRREFARELRGPGAAVSDLEDWRTGKFPPNQYYEMQMAVMGLNTLWFHTGQGAIMRFEVPASPDDRRRSAMILENGSTE